MSFLILIILQLFFLPLFGAKKKTRNNIALKNSAIEGFIHICSISPLDARFTDDYLYKNSKTATFKSDPQILSILNLFFANASGTLKSRVKILTNGFQYGVSTFLKKGERDSLFVSVNPTRIRGYVKEKQLQDESISYLLIHALSHIAQNDFLTHDNSMYARFYSELKADKSAGNEMIRLFPKETGSWFFEQVLPVIIYNETDKNDSPPIFARVMAANSGFLESILPGTFEQMLSEGSEGILPSQRDSIFKELKRNGELDEVKDEGMLVGGTGELAYGRFWMKFYRDKDSCYSYVAKAFKLNAKNDDDDEAEDGDESDGTDQLVAKSPFYYESIGKRNDKSSNIRYVKDGFGFELHYSQDRYGYGRIVILEDKIFGKYISVWENGDVFIGKKLNRESNESPKAAYQGTLNSKSGTKKIGKFNRAFKSIN